MRDESIKKIAVIGSGYVGTTTAALLANAGFDVRALDIDNEKVKKLNSGKAPFYEAGLDVLITAAKNNKSLKATSSYQEAISDADVVISCVGTPDNPDGSSNLSYVLEAAQTASQYLKPDALYVQKSTVPVGTGRKVIKKLPSSVNYVSNPEFLREGTAIEDTLFFDRVVVGGDDPKTTQQIANLYRNLELHSEKIAKLAGSIKPDKPKATEGLYIQTTLESAELIKVTANAFLALKISFANSIAKLCDETNADINDVMDAVGADVRIGRAFLNAGRGYGGGCFPKDVSGLISSALEYGAELPIMHASTEVNESMAGYIVTKAEKQLGNIKGRKLAILGLAFKAGTSDARKSPAVKVANYFADAGTIVSAYDPEANDEAKEDLHKNISLHDSLADCLKDCEIVCVATDWLEFKDINIFKQAPQVTTVIDAMNCLDKGAIDKLGLAYIGVGR